MSNNVLMSEWKLINEAPKDVDILAFGFYIYPGDKDPTIYYRIGSVEGEYFYDEEGTHPLGFVTHFQPLPSPPMGISTRGASNRKEEVSLGAGQEQFWEEAESEFMQALKLQPMISHEDLSEAPPSLDESREKFEAWCVNKLTVDIEHTYHLDNYCNHVANSAWLAWQARQPEITAMQDVIEEIAKTLELADGREDGETFYKASVEEALDIAQPFRRK